MPLRVLFIGRLDAPEFTAAIDWLDQHTVLHCVADVETATEQLRSGIPADTILIAASYRSQFTLPRIRELQATSPLSRLCVVVGSWCEGETRSGNAWPGIERIYVHQLIPRARSEGWELESSRASLSPDTASSDERWLARASRTRPIESAPIESAPIESGPIEIRPRHSRPIEPGLVLVCGRDKDSRMALVELCRWAGFQTISMRSPRGPDGNPTAVIYDADRNRQQRIRDLRHLSHGLPEARIFALIEYPRHDEIRTALDAGCDQVLGKPYDIDDLLALITPRIGVSRRAGLSAHFPDAETERRLHS